MIGKIFISILLATSVCAMNHNARLNGNFVSEEDNELMEPFKYVNGHYNVIENEQVAVRFSDQENKRFWIYAQIVMVPVANSHVGLASRSPIGDQHKNFALDFKNMMVRKFKERNTGK